MKEALRYSAALLGELRTSLLRWALQERKAVHRHLKQPSPLAVCPRCTISSCVCASLLFCLTLTLQPPKVLRAVHASLRRAAQLGGTPSLAWHLLIAATVVLLAAASNCRVTAARVAGCCPLLPLSH